MCAQYRKTRSIDATCVDTITTKLSDGGWTEITVQKHYKNIKNLTLPIIVVRVADTTHERIQIGDSTMIRRPIIIIDIFATSDGNREDLKDFLIDELKDGMIMYDYTTTTSGRNTTVNTKIANGRITILNIEDTPLDMDTDKENLSPVDRFKHRITLSCLLSKLEA